MSSYPKKDESFANEKVKVTGYMRKKKGGKRKIVRVDSYERKK